MVNLEHECKITLHPRFELAGGHASGMCSLHALVQAMCKQQDANVDP